MIISAETINWKTVIYLRQSLGPAQFETLRFKFLQLLPLRSAV